MVYNNLVVVTKRDIRKGKSAVLIKLKVMIHTLQKQESYTRFIAKKKERQFRKKVNAMEYSHRANQRHVQSISHINSDWAKIFEQKKK